MSLTKRYLNACEDILEVVQKQEVLIKEVACLLYTSDAADEE